ncbi:hypothetical protein CDAR_420871 [Caerostris darwini]|uniref:Uncharacterized protein n=1 Tax=Caerostris darwini TaxID=1538125 RepID=A0AAV4X2B7_9ARAC|nr:hypothetical protein CDAR_420871 [Caerostris darwini]
MHFQVGNVVLSNDPLPRPPRSSRKTMVYEMIMTIVPLASGSEWCLSINGSFYPVHLIRGGHGLWLSTRFSLSYIFIQKQKGDYNIAFNLSYILNQN